MTMYDLTIRKTFSAAHTLTIGGKCETLHGHNFAVEVTVSSDFLDSEGIVIDFRLLKGWTNEIIEEMDHTYLNDLPLFQGLHPTSENIAGVIYDRIASMIDNPEVHLSRVTVWESDSARVSYGGNR